MNTGTLTVNTAGTDNYEIRYRKIKNPLEVKKMINDKQTTTVIRSRKHSNSLDKKK